MTQKRICLGQIGKANGIQGHVRVKPFTGEPEALSDYGKLEDESGQTNFKVASLRAIKGGMLVVKFKGVNDRNAAEALNGTKLYIDRDKLPDVDDEDDFYVEDLLGLDVVTTTGDAFGRVANVDNYGAGDLIDIKPDNGPSVLVPFTKHAVPEVDLAGRKITIDTDAAGLNGDNKVRGDVG